jgi:hypothetical protein
MQVGPDPEQAAGGSAPAYVIRYTYSFEGALEAGRFFQARLYSLYVGALGMGLLVGAVATVYNLSFGLSIVLFCAVLLLMARFAVMDRLFARRRMRSLIGGSVELVLKDDGLGWTGPRWSGHAPWSSITEVRANRRTVLFVGDRLLLAYAPAESFATAAERADVVAYSRQRVAAAQAGHGPTSSG